MIPSLSPYLPSPKIWVSNLPYEPLWAERCRLLPNYCGSCSIQRRYKSVAALFGTRQRLSRPGWPTHVAVAGSDIKKYLTIWRFLVSQSTHRWRSTLKWQRQSGVVIFIYSHSLRQLRSSLPHDVAQSVASAIIGSRLDYCNCTTACQTRTSRGYRECRMLLLELFAKIHDANLTQPSFLRIGYRCVAESTTRLLSSVIKPSNCNNLRVLLVYSRHTDSRVFWGYPRQTYFQHSLHRQTRLLVGSHAALPPFGTVSFICTLRWQFH